MAEPFYDPTDPVELGSLLREEFRPKTFVRSRIFNMFEENFDSETYEMQIQTKSRKVAPLNTNKSDPIVTKRDGWESQLVKFPYSKQARAFTCKEKFARKAGKTLFPEGRNARAEMEEQILDDVMDFNWDLDRREELMCIQAMTTGQLVLPERTIDFKMRPDHLVTLTGGDLWTDPSAKIIAGIRELVKRVRRHCGLGQIDMIVGEEAYAAFLAHQEIKDCLDNRRINLGSIDPLEIGGAMRVGFLTDPAVNLWTYDEYFQSPQDGIGLVDEVEMYPVDKITIFSRQGRQGFGYAGIAHTAAPSRERRYVHTWFDDKKGEHWMSLESSPCPLMQQPNAILTAKVV